MFSYPFLNLQSWTDSHTWSFCSLKLHVTKARSFFANYILFFNMLYSVFVHFLSPSVNNLFSVPNCVGLTLNPAFTSISRFLHLLLTASLALGSEALYSFATLQPHTHLRAVGAEFLHTACSDLSHLHPPSFQNNGLKNKVTNHFLDWRFMHWSLFSPGTFYSPLILSVAHPYTISESNKVWSI